MYYDSQIQIPPASRFADVAPGRNRATLTLSNGQTIPLDEEKGQIIIRPEKLTYADGTKIPVADPTAIQTITTPKGGQYQVELPDGTNVWLNAESILQYATNLNVEQGKRRVRLVSGEAYFSVTKNRKLPFVVISRDQEVQVLGTEFNVNTYLGHGQIKTTLLEGSVKVSSENNMESITLVPGQQAVTNRGKITAKQADVQLETAWKRGKTEFEDADLNTVMGMLERWYDIQTIYLTSNTEARFTGSVSRKKNISAVLKLLESTGEVHFKIEGRKVYVMK
ncbi:FecR family protein [Pedobacter deserti]|uniref:FecR family protein n=1 Tax=Pedobacter deserti TaxID=2817382 RepID=UPI0021091F86|nr:FecR family protein [Pedobacter sp. SYSU D00382]